MGKDNITPNSIVVISDDEDDNITKHCPVIVIDSDSDDGWRLRESVFMGPTRAKVNSPLSLPTTEAIVKSDRKRKRAANESTSNAQNHKKAKNDPGEGQVQKARAICTGKTTSHLYSTKSSSSRKKNAVGPGSTVPEHDGKSTSTPVCSSQSQPSTSTCGPLDEITPGSTGITGQSGIKILPVPNTAAKNCPICTGGTSTCVITDNVKKHFTDTHIFRYHRCIKCNMDFQDKEKLRQHLNQPEHAITCPYCHPNKKEVPACKLALHLMEIHNPHESSWPCPFPQCGVKVTSHIRFVEHYRAKHYIQANSLPGFGCVQCEKKDLDVQSGLAHYIRDHNVVSDNGTLRSLERMFGVEWSLQLQLPPNEAPSLKDRKVVWSTNATAATTHTHTTSKKGKVTNATSKKRKVTMSEKGQCKHLHSLSNKGKQPKPKKEASKIARSRQESENHPPDTTATQELMLPCGRIENLSKFLHILFVDLDNWGKFFELPYLLPNVFVWGFCGGAYTAKKYQPPLYHKLIKEKRFFSHPKCGKSKNAADFALCVQAARLDLVLPVHIPFTVLSGDKGFDELRMQLATSARKIHLVDPHHIAGPELLNAILNSIGEQ